MDKSQEGVERYEWFDHGIHVNFTLLNEESFDAHNERYMPFPLRRLDVDLKIDVSVWTFILPSLPL